MFPTWKDFYQSDLQGVYALWLVPLGFLVYWLVSRPSGERCVDPRATSFFNVYAPLFVVETVLDPFVTGPLARWLELREPAATHWMLPWVLLGDFRVYLLVLFLMAPERGVGRAIGTAAAWTLVVPIFAWSVMQLLARQYDNLPPQTIWVVYESAFFAVAMFLALSYIPSRLDRRRYELLEYLQTITRYVALYYALWAISDVLTTWGGYDFGWGLRVIPNQLYYSFWVPLAYFWFFSARYAVTRRPVHASR